MWSLAMLAAGVMSMGSIVAVLHIVGLDHAGWWQVPFFGISAALALWLWHSLPWTDRVSRFASIGACMLIAWILSRIVWTLDFLLAGERFSQWEVYSGDAAWSVLQAEVISVVGALIALVIWFLSGGAAISFEKASIALSQRTPRRLFRLVYAVSLLSLLLDSFAAIPAPLRELVNWWRFGGLASLLLLALTSDRAFWRVLAALSLASAPFVLASLDDAMKESIIQALLPLIMFLVIRVRRGSARALLVLGLVTGLSLITAFNSFTRLNLRTTNNEFTYEFVREFVATVSSTGVKDVALLGADDLLRRANTGNYRGYAVAIAHNEGFKPDLVFGPALYSPIPRAVWPDKPLNIQGDDYNVLVFGRSGSSMSSGLFAGAYLGGGWVGVLSVAAILGLVFAICSWLAGRYGCAAFHFFYGFSMIPVALRIDEGWVGSSLVTPASGLVYLVLLHATASTLLRLRGRVIGRQGRRIPA
jgi:hypothetical protein